MLKWKILAVLGLAFGVAGIVWGYAQEKKAVGFFEAARVQCPARQAGCTARFANRTAAIFARHGITNVGYWISQIARQREDRKRWLPWVPRTLPRRVWTPNGLHGATFQIAWRSTERCVTV